MGNLSVPESAYQALIEDLSRIRDEAMGKVLKVVNTVLIESYWRMGKRLYEDKDISTQRGLIQKIANDLAVEYSFLTRVMRFFSIWTDECPVEKFPYVTWTHYRALLSLVNEKERNFYLEQTNSKRWNTRQLVQQIKNDSYALQQQKYTVTSQEVEGIKEGIPILKQTVSPMHTYSAILEKVVDGDTLVLFVDLGFDVWRRQRIRLRGINTPEAKTPEGDNATDFVQKTLRAIRPLVVRTYKTDIYGRYVADIYFLAGERNREKIVRQGKLLNQELHFHTPLLARKYHT